MTLIKVNQPTTRAFRTNFGFEPHFNDLLDNLFTQHPMTKTVFGKQPAVNVMENENSYQLEFAVPGYAKEEFKISIEKNVLSVSVEKKEEAETETAKVPVNYSKREFNFSSFNRSFNLPENVNAEQVKAEYKNGILFVTVPKQEQEKPSKKDITVE